MSRMIRLTPTAASNSGQVWVRADAIVTIQTGGSDGGAHVRPDTLSPFYVAESVADICRAIWCAENDVDHAMVFPPMGKIQIMREEARRRHGPRNKPPPTPSPGSGR